MSPSLLRDLNAGQLFCDIFFLERAVQDNQMWLLLIDKEVLFNLFHFLFFFSFYLKLVYFWYSAAPITYKLKFATAV